MWAALAEDFLSSLLANFGVRGAALRGMARPPFDPERPLLSRDAGLRRVSRLTRWAAAGGLVLTGLLAKVAADSFSGHTASAAPAAAQTQSKSQTSSPRSNQSSTQSSNQSSDQSSTQSSNQSSDDVGLMVGRGEVLGEIQAPAAIVAELDEYRIHPCLLDSCFQLLLGLADDSKNSQDRAAYLPAFMRRTKRRRIRSHSPSRWSTRSPHPAKPSSTSPM